MKTNKYITFLLVFLVMLIVNMTLFSPLPATTKLIIRILLLAIFFASWRWFHKKDLTELKNLAFAFMALNLAFLIVSPFTPGFWHFKPDTSQGFALSKLSDSVIISGVLIISFIIGGYKLNSIYLAKGRLIPGLVIGTIAFIVFGYLAINNPQAKMGPGFISKNFVWILIFVFANSFMEELLFRGIFLEKLNCYFKPVWSIVLTSICFAAPHLTVNYSPNVLFFSGIVFVLGMMCGYAMQYTRSIIAPMLIHAGADLMIIVPVFAAYGVTS
ncbi:MAG: type II CAAX endopeptidase family protein [Bacteroidota bacterium]